MDAKKRCAPRDARPRPEGERGTTLEVLEAYRAKRGRYAGRSRHEIELRAKEQSGHTYRDLYRRRSIENERKADARTVNPSGPRHLGQHVAATRAVGDQPDDVFLGYARVAQTSAHDDRMRVPEQRLDDASIRPAREPFSLPEGQCTTRAGAGRVRPKGGLGRAIPVLRPDCIRRTRRAPDQALEGEQRFADSLFTQSLDDLGHLVSIERVDHGDEDLARGCLRPLRAFAQGIERTSEHVDRP